MQRSTPDAATQALQAASTARVLQTHVEPKDDLAAERRRATFDVQQLAEVLAGGPGKLEKRARFVELLKQTTWGDKSRRHFLTREEEYVGALQAAFGIWDKMQKDGLSLEDGIVMRSLVDFPGGLELHIGMFIPTIRSQGTPEQQQHWLPLCYNLNIIGTYAQTELGHGTYIRGLETTATYDSSSQEFIVHTPTLTATKWWPGGMGKTATHAVVMARLFLAGKDHGPHAFIVQLRDMQTHLPLAGVKVGDIGPKFGYGGVDNGYLAFDHVRIPRDQMLMRFTKVSTDGVYTPPPPSNSKASYATMVYVRADIVKNAGNVLARAVTIATRYAAVRRQTAPAPGQLETQVLDYQNTAATLLPLIANAYALHFAGETMMALYRQFEKDRDRGEFGKLPELHALSSGLKALCTWITADGIEQCRRTCGGHGYSKLSGLPTLYQNYVQNVTWEGDNAVMCLQTARYLVKALVAVGAGDSRAAQGSAAYLAGAQQELQALCLAKGEGCWQQGEVQAAALRHVATRAAVKAVETLQASTVQEAAARGTPVPRGGLVFEGPAWNSSTLALIHLARSHCMSVLHSNMLQCVESERQAGRLGSDAAGVLRQCASLLATSHMSANVGHLLEDGYITGQQASALQAAYHGLLQVLRPNAVALVDVFGLEDYVLNSALGKQDGDVYRALLEMAQASPLNETEEGPAWELVLKPAMTKGAAAGLSKL